MKKIALSRNGGAVAGANIGKLAGFIQQYWGATLTVLRVFVPAALCCARTEGLGSARLVFYGFARKQSPAIARGDGVVYLDQDDGSDRTVWVDETQGGAAGVEGLRDDNAADDGGVDFRREIVDQEMGARGVAPAPVKCESEQQDVAPIDEERGAVVDELGEQRCGKWRETDGAEEADVDPGKVAVGTREVVELSLLADPEDAIGHDAHEKDEQARRHGDEQVAKVVLGVNGFGGGDTQVEDQQRHGDGEDTVAEDGDALHTLTCNAIVEGVHPREFSIGIWFGV